MRAQRKFVPVRLVHELKNRDRCSVQKEMASSWTSGSHMVHLISLSFPYCLTLRRQKRRRKNKLPFSARFKASGKSIPHLYLHVHKLPSLCFSHSFAYCFVDRIEGDTQSSQEAQLTPHINF